MPTNTLPQFDSEVEDFGADTEQSWVLSLFPDDSVLLTKFKHAAEACVVLRGFTEEK